MSLEKNKILLEPIKELSGFVKLPGSKSLSNRALVLSLMAEGTTHIQNLLDSDDVRVMVDALSELKIPFSEEREKHEITVTGCAGQLPVKGAKLFLGNAGTAMRSLTAVAAVGEGTFILDGIPRMRERPIIDLVEGLTQLGVKIRCIETPNCPPVEIQANGIPGGTTQLSGSISSQYLSAILMAAPYAKNDVRIMIKDKLVSIPYVQMTLKLMERFGIEVVDEDHQVFHIKGKQIYHSPGNTYVEGDASSASYFLGGAAITGGTITIEGCGTESLQGDARFATVLEQMGAEVEYKHYSITLKGKSLRGIDIDMNAMPDAAMTLAVVALFAEGPTAIRNIYNWRVKESERIKAVRIELEKLGAHVEEGEDYLVITPPLKLQSTTVDTYDDHRMAMAFSLAACGGVPVEINDPQCVNKTFPNYFDVLASAVSH